MAILKVLVKKSPAPMDIIGLYTKDPEGEATLLRVVENLMNTRPDWDLVAWEFQTNVPNR